MVSEGLTMKKNLVSIVTPCYNGEYFIRRFLKSILNQTYSNIEMILINDGSTDRTEEIVREFQNEFSKRGIRFVYQYPVSYTHLTLPTNREV